MAQNDYGNPTSPFTGTQLNNRLRNWRDALHSLHQGTSRPSYAVAGMLWIRNISSTEWRLHLYDGDTDILIGTINPTTNTFTPAGVTGFAPLTGATFTGPVVVPNATENGHALNRITADGRYAQLAGATFTGNVIVAKADPVLILDKTASGQSARILGRTSGANRWGVELGTATAEGGGNAGSNFIIRRYDNSGAVLGAPIVIDRASGAVTLEALLTLPNTDPTNPNHAARKAYVDAGDVWIKLTDAAVTNSTIIDVTGFSLQDYRMVTVLLLGARLSSSSSSAITARLYRGGSLVNTGYTFVREGAAGTGIAASTTTNGADLILTWSSGANTSPMLLTIDIAQPTSSDDAIYRVRNEHNDSQPIFVVSRAGGRLTSGSGWVDGFRITAPVAFQNNVGRVVVLGLKP
jgi:hypothetical protein